MRNLDSRKYCLDCSPFGLHNTRDVIRLEQPMECVECHKALPNRRRRFCQTCIKKKARYKLKKKIYDYLGEIKCWVCGYDKGETGMYVLAFHHVNSEEKEFEIAQMLSGVQNFNLLLKEIRKCISICPNCHSEFHHAKTIEEETLQKIYLDKWTIIENSHK